MKKTNLFQRLFSLLWVSVVFLSLSFFSCSVEHNEEVTFYEGINEEINLSTPSGLEVFTSFLQLNIFTQEEAKSIFGNNITAIVTDVTYFETSENIVAFISYETSNGESKNYALSFDGTTPVYKVRCEGTCASSEESCIIMGTIKEDVVTFSCSCSGCTAVVEYIISDKP